MLIPVVSRGKLVFDATRLVQATSTVRIELAVGLAALPLLHLAILLRLSHFVVLLTDLLLVRRVFRIHTVRQILEPSLKSTLLLLLLPTYVFKTDCISSLVLSFFRASLTAYQILRPVLRCLSFHQLLTLLVS